MEKEHKKDIYHQNEKGKLITITFQSPVSLKNSFKAKVSSEGKSVRDVLCRLMEKYIRDEL